MARCCSQRPAQAPGQRIQKSSHKHAVERNAFVRKRLAGAILGGTGSKRLGMTLRTSVGQLSKIAIEADSICARFREIVQASTQEAHRIQSQSIRRSLRGRA
jgi:hypothetical protein